MPIVQPTLGEKLNPCIHDDVRQIHGSEYMGVRPQTHLGGHQIFARKVCHYDDISKNKKKKKGHRLFRCTFSITFGLNMPSNVSPNRC